MKRILFLAVVALAGCGQQKEVTPQEAWQKFCTSIPSASYNIMTDRQQGIAKEKALEHAKKLQEPKAQQYVVSLIEEAYKVPLYDQMTDKEKAMDDFTKNRYESCLKQ